MKALILRLDAPLMSFGGVMIDQHGFIERFPGTSLLTGLVANALGWGHGDYERLEGPRTASRSIGQAGQRQNLEHTFATGITGPTAS